MKKKSFSVAPPSKVEKQVPGEIPYFCQTAEVSALHGIALRVIVSGIPKHRPTRETEEVEKAAKKYEK